MIPSGSSEETTKKLRNRVHFQKEKPDGFGVRAYIMELDCVTIASMVFPPAAGELCEMEADAQRLKVP